MIAEQTNLYTRQVMSSEAFAKYVPVTQPEIEAYLGFMILLGINQLPSLYDYWKKDPQFHYSPCNSGQNNTGHIHRNIMVFTLC